MTSSLTSPASLHSRSDRVVVIGAGIGGLACALRLAAAGARVTVLERAYAPGGKMRTLPTPCGPADTGPTVMTMRPVFEELFAAAGARLDDHVRLHREAVLARHFWRDGSRLDLHDDAERSAAAVEAFAGARAAAEFHGFARRARRLFEAFQAPMMETGEPSQGALALQVMRQPALAALMAPHRSLAGLLARQFSDPRLAQLFGRYATYVGGSPYQSPALLSLIFQAEAAGVWRVEGGMHALARATAALAEARGAEFHYDTHVDRIEVQGGRARAAIAADGRRFEGVALVFNGDPKALAEGLLGPGAREAVPRAQVTPRSLSAYVHAFGARPSPVPLVHHNVFFGADPRREFDALRAGRMPDDPTLYVCAQDRGGDAPPAQTERFEIIMNGPPARAGGDEEAQACRTRVFGTLGQFGLTFDPVPGPAALTTPAGFAALFPGSDGSLYGRSPHGLTAGLKRPTARSRLPGLYLAGGGAHPGAGIPMATLSARHAAAAIWNDLASTSTSLPTVTPGGMSTGSRTTARAPSRSSVS